MTSPKLNLLATTAFGLEAITARELRGLGYAAEIVQPGRILFRGDETSIIEANLWLRTADRVLLRLGSFRARDFGELFDRTQVLPWEDWIPADAAFPVNGKSVKSQLSSVPACQKIVKKAIVEKLLSAHGATELPETGVVYRLEVALLKDEVTLSIDTTGPSLHKRGYRKLVGPAPLKETLSAALVLLSFWTPQRPLIDPFCGSGTIPIEAALIGRNRAPGLEREFAAEAWPNLRAALWQEARDEARGRETAELPVRIIGTDIDEETLSLARYHAAQAGVAGDIHFQQRPFAELLSKREYGCVITNPPYGERLQDDQDLDELYRSVPIVLRRLKTWSHYVLTAYPDFEKLLGQQADRRRKLYNGRIECTYYQFHGPRPPKEGQPPGVEEVAEAEDSDTQASAVTRDSPRVFGGLNDDAQRQAEEFRNRLAKRARHLRRWPTRQDITCYRLYERDVPGVPLVVDCYEDHLHMAEFERPHERTPAQHADWLDLMVRTAADVLDVPRAKIFLKTRRRQQGLDQYQRQGDAGHELIVGEGGLRFQVNLADYLDTGLFLDHRQTRALVRDDARDKRFLNLFCYTGAFTVYAADAPARSTTSVDLSQTYLQWAEENLRLNKLEGPQHQFVRADVMEFLQSQPPDSFDLAVVDPPTFSNSRRTDQDWDVQRQHVPLLQAVLRCISPGGVVYFSTNFRRFKLDEAALEGVSIREISKQTIPPDFRNQRIHRCWRMVRA